MRHFFLFSSYSLGFVMPSFFKPLPRLILRRCDEFVNYLNKDLMKMTCGGEKEERKVENYQDLCNLSRKIGEFCSVTT